MNIAADLLRRLRASGVVLTAREGALFARPGSRMTDDLRAAVRVNRDALLRLLEPASSWRAIRPSGDAFEFRVLPPASRTELALQFPQCEFEPLAGR